MIVFTPNSQTPLTTAATATPPTTPTLPAMPVMPAVSNPSDQGDQPDLASLIAAVDAADSAPKIVRAVVALAATRSPDAIVKLIEVLRYNNPGAAVAAVEGLVAIGEPAVQPLLELLDGYNYGARAWAMRALSQIGDPRALAVLLEATVDFSLSVRRAAAKGLGSLQWHTVDPAKLDDLRSPVLEALTRTSSDAEWVVRYGAIVGLEALAHSTFTSPSPASEQLLTKIQTLLTQAMQADAEIVVRSRAGLARQRLQPA